MIEFSKIKLIEVSSSLERGGHGLISSVDGRKNGGKIRMTIKLWSIKKLYTALYSRLSFSRIFYFSWIPRKYSLFLYQ